jgi:hypothetical protein
MTHAKTICLALLTTLAVFVAGCIACELRVTNHTGGVIQFYSGHTKQAVQIGNETTRTVAHAGGRIIIITQEDQIWEYDTVNTPDFASDLSKGFKKLILPLTVESNGVLVLPSGRKVEPSRILNPE